ncbi:aminotransferase class I/II-fold pyridoxal phosphate-dependent enzyme, partial [Burkholderia pseudomallei]
YLPIARIAAPDAPVQNPLLGAESPLLAAGRVVTAQARGGTGALKIGADYRRTLNPKAKVAISEPSWDNHRALFDMAGFEV